MQVGIFGAGYVGLCTCVMVAELGHNVICYDPDNHKIDLLYAGICPIHEPELGNILLEYQIQNKIKFTTSTKKATENSEIIFICVGTPSSEDGTANTTYVETAIANILENVNNDLILVMKSTVPVGMAKKIKKQIVESNCPYKIEVVSNPEFLREGTAIFDTRHPNRIIIGCDDKETSAKMSNFYKTHYPKLCCDNVTAEIIKYASNSFLATKISFINVIAQLCDKTGGNVEFVAEGMGLDKRIGEGFLRPGIGYGGSCFGKDVSALIKICEDYNIDNSMLKSTKQINENQVNYVLFKILLSQGSLVGKNLLVLGLSFKPDTDDLRDAPSIRLVKALINNGANVFVHDPACGVEFIKLVPEATLVKDVLEAAKGTHAVVLVTEWRDYSFLDWTEIYKNVEFPNIFDCRNALVREELEKIGFNYWGIGI